MKKVIILGIDGGTFDIIKNHNVYSDLKNFQFLEKNGFSSILESTIPPVTGPAWTTVSTGLNPGNHPIFDFVVINRKNYQKELVNSQNIEEPKLWDYISEYDLSSIVVNVPTTYPPKLKKGIMLSGMLTPPNSEFFYPLEKKNKYSKELDGYIIEESRTNLGSNKKFLNKLIDISDKRFNLFEKLLDDNPWQFAFLVFRGSDIIQHTYYESKNDLVFEYYKFLDNIIGKVISKYIDDETLLIIMSDHGFSKTKWDFYINSWLIKEGYLNLINKKLLHSHKINFCDVQYTTKRSGITKVLFDLGITSDNLNKVIRFLHLDSIRKYVPQKIKDKIPIERKKIDYSNTIAYALTSESNAININLKGREVLGVVEPNDYEKVRNKIISKLKSLKDPDGKKVFEKVWTREQVYPEKYIDDAPDIIFRFRDHEYITRTEMRDIIFSSTVVSSCHHRNGILYAYNPKNFKESNKKVSKIADIFPTVLYYLGIPIPNNLDGKKLDIFQKDIKITKDLKKNSEKGRIGNILKKLSL